MKEIKSLIIRLKEIWKYLNWEKWCLEFKMWELVSKNEDQNQILNNSYKIVQKYINLVMSIDSGILTAYFNICND